MTRSFVLSALLACRTDPRPLSQGQWVWTSGDAAAVEERRRTEPEVVALVLIGELSFDGEEIRTALRNSPTVVRAPRGVVVRPDDSVASAFAGRSDAELAAALDAPLGRLLAQAEQVGGPPDEVQLDFDCPVRLLPRWGEVVGLLERGALRERHPWVTSLVAHVTDPTFAPALHERVEGHVLQVFDTGDRAVDADEVGRAAAAAKMRYRLGVGTFERQRDGVQVTDHRAWLEQVDRACLPPWCIGVDRFGAQR
ncbi:MAG: hypothetical protein KC621_18420 [Myxococcales bacterium]|nr:hypothetical protein [Myxococcales bacterium]